MPTLTGRSIKVVIPLDPAELAAFPVPEGVPRVLLQIRVGERRVTADIAAKAVRKAIGTVAEHGAETTITFIQGKLGPGDAVLEAGLVANVKAPKPVEVAA
jgi:hypothetical protein